MSKRIAIVGAGGFAREVRWLLRDIDDDWNFAGFVVTDLAKTGAHDSSDEIVGDFSWLQTNRNQLHGVAIGIGSPAARLRVGAALSLMFLPDQLPALVHPSVRMDRTNCTLGEGALLCAGSIATVHVTFGPFCLVNLSCTIGHEAVIGRGSVLNPTVNISGGVQIGEGVLVGTGAQVLQYLVVGDGATVGAGAVVTKNVAASDTVVGVPARPRP
jgi:sugar O-acyltransferase (sialic acid O-acetyltransferase NeuD family)